MICKNHKLVKVYYRKPGKKNYQDWMVIKNKLICQKCEQIFDVKHTQTKG